ncbi:MAG: alkaline phosphatase family protein [Sphingobacteriales bacterium]|nr:MAG: alkaline phosphatase family protein [Sphingobacteriales bacterium]
MSSLLHIRLLFSRFALALLAFTLCRLVFWLFNFHGFSAYSFLQNISAFFSGLLFDVSALIYLLAPFILLHILPISWRNSRVYQIILKILFVIGLSIGIGLNLMDSQYYKFSGKRSGADLFTAQNDIGGLWMNYITDYWFLLPIFIAFIWLIIKYYPKLKINPKKKEKFNIQKHFLQWIYMALIAGIAFIGARGGIGLRPIRPFDAARFVPPGLVSLTLNTPFQIIGTAQGQYVEIPEYMSQKEADIIHPVIHQYKNNLPFRKKNVVVIILESFGKEYVGYFNQGKGYTPFLDSLCKKSLVCTQAYANGKRSSDAIPAILASLPSLLDVPYINSVYSDTRINTLGYYLQQTGYSSSFFHGARNGSMGFDNFLQLAGNGEYFGMNEYPNQEDFDGSWGIFDEPYFQYFGKNLTQRKQPFCAAVFSLTSHHPYPIPKKYKNKFEEGSLPIHKTIRYSDFSLRQFFIYASRQKWFNNTLFVITADHSAENDTPFYQGIAGKYAVPLLFYTPDGSLQGTINKPVSHCDIMPSVLDFLHYKKPFFSLGNSIFSSDKTAAMHFDSGLFQYIKDTVVYHFDGKNSSALYSYPKDSFLRNNILEGNDSLAAKYQLETKAYLQQYFNRLNSAGFILPSK